MRSWSSKTWAGNPDSLVPEAWAKIPSQRLLLTANRNQDFLIFICTIFGPPPNFVLIHIKTFYNKMYCVCAHTHSRNKMIPISWWRVWPQALQICEEVLRGWVPACLGRICNQDPNNSTSSHDLPAASAIDNVSISSLGWNYHQKQNCHGPMGLMPWVSLKDERLIKYLSSNYYELDTALVIVCKDASRRYTALALMGLQTNQADEKHSIPWWSKLKVQHVVVRVSRGLLWKRFEETLRDN